MPRSITEKIDFALVQDRTTEIVWRKHLKIQVNMCNRFQLTSFMGRRSFKISEYRRRTSVGVWILVKWSFSMVSRSSSRPSLIKLSSKIARFVQFKSSWEASSTGFQTITKSIDRSPSAKNNDAYCVLVTSVTASGASL